MSQMTPTWKWFVSCFDTLNIDPKRCVFDVSFSSINVKMINRRGKISTNMRMSLTSLFIFLSTLLFYLFFIILFNSFFFSFLLPILYIFFPSHDAFQTGWIYRSTVEPRSNGYLGTIKFCLLQADFCYCHYKKSEMILIVVYQVTTLSTSLQEKS